MLRVAADLAMTRVPTDADLLADWSAGSRAAGDELIERNFALVHRFFRNKVGAELEDLVQQTFLACVEARERYAGHASFKTFLLAIARNQLFTHYARQRRRALDFELTSVHDLGTSPSAVVAQREDERLLAEALRRVPLEAQVVLELAYWEACDGSEIARVLDVPLNTAYSRLRRARIALRERLQELAPDRMTQVLAELRGPAGDGDRTAAELDDDDGEPSARSCG
jgi:RNA polymerase sigma-70 factor (ECF subfamily)